MIKSRAVRQVEREPLTLHHLSTGSSFRASRGKPSSTLIQLGKTSNTSVHSFHLRHSVATSFSFSFKDKFRIFFYYYYSVGAFVTTALSETSVVYAQLPMKNSPHTNVLLA